MRAVVVGAGIGGLATAIALEQAGVEPIVIERAPQLHEAGFGLVVSANAVRALRSLELRDCVAARGTRVRRAEVRNPRGDLLTEIDYEALGWETYGILRAELQQAMLEAVPAGPLRLGTTCISASEDGDVLLDGADAMVADMVVGADGIRSAVRQSLFGEEPLRYGGHRAWRAGTRFDDERVTDRFVEVWGVGGGFGFGPAGPGRVYWYCFEVVPDGAPAPDRPRDEFLRLWGAFTRFSRVALGVDSAVSAELGVCPHIWARVESVARPADSEEPRSLVLVALLSGFALPAATRAAPFAFGSVQGAGDRRASA